MTKDKTKPFAAARIDLSNDPLSRKAAGDDMVDILPSSKIDWGHVGLTFAGAAVAGWGVYKVSKLAFKGVAELLKASRRTNGQAPEKKPVRAAYMVK